MDRGRVGTSCAATGTTLRCATGLGRRPRPVLCAVGYVKLAFPSGAVPNLIPDVLGATFAVLAAAHAVYIATHAEVKTPRPGYTRWYGLAGCVAGFLALIFLLRFRVLTSGSRGATLNFASIRPTRCLARTARDPA